MDKATKRRIDALKTLGLFTAKDAQKKARISQPTLSRLTKKGVVHRIRRGFYIHSEAKVASENQDFAVACSKFGPKSAIGGLSALFHYGLIEQVPNQIWIVVPPNRTDRNRLYRCLRTKISLRYGVKKKESYRITNLERTLLEAMRFGTKIGPRVAIQATRKALQDGMTSEAKIGQMAGKLKLRGTLEKYWEAIVS
jgi:predicted transcriptional regulator of viral defense system